MKLHDAGTGTAGGTIVLRLIRFLQLTGFNRLGIIGGSFPLFKGNGACRTVGQTVPKTVTEVLSDEFCLSVDDIDSTLMAGLGAESAAVALFFVYMDDFSDPSTSPPLAFLP